MVSQSDKLKELLLENAIGVEEFGYCLGIDIKLAENLVSGKKKVTNTIARKIEQTFCKPSNWLESPNQEGGASYDLFG